MSKENPVSIYLNAYKEGIGAGASVVGIVAKEVSKKFVNGESSHNKGVAIHAARKAVILFRNLQHR